MRRLVTIVLLPLLVGCGDDAPAPQALPQGPVELFAKMKTAMGVGDWSAVYDMFEPSERQASEKRWDAMRAEVNQTGSAHKARLDGFALEVQRPAAEVAAMDLRTFFAARNEAQRSNASQLQRFVEEATVKGVKELEDGVVMVHYEVDGSRMEMPMKQTDGRWYLWRTLAALTDF